MKNQILVIFTIFLAAFHSYGQVDRTNFRAGLTGGLVLGDFSEAYSLNLGLEVQHLWGISREIDVGLATGFFNAFGEKQTFSEGGLTVETQFDNVQYIPVAGAIRIYPTTGFKLGGDVGYAVGINEGNEGGFYFRPVVGVDINGVTELNVSYANFGGDTVFSSALVGLLFLF